MRNRTLSLKQTIFASLLSSLLLMAVLLAIVTLGFNRSIDDSRREHRVMQTAMVAMLDARFHAVQVQQFLTDVGATGERGGFAEAEEQYTEAKQSLKEIEGLMPDFSGDIGDIGQAFDAFYGVGKTMAEAYVVEGQAAGNALMKQPESGFDARAEALTTRLEALEKKLRELMERTAAETESHISGARLIALLIGSGVMLLTVGSGVLMYRSILRMLGAEPGVAIALVENIASGDLTQTVPLRHGDSSSLLAFQQKMQLSLRTVVTEIAESVHNTEQSARALATASSQVAASSDAMSESAASMAAGVQEMSVSIDQVSADAQSALGISNRAGQLASEGGAVIESAISTINAIAETVRSMAANLASLSADSEKITAVVQVIREVADQTNLLALNAAIEAARAGEQGRGFAVVADEVRKLAERTAGATTEINNTILKVQADTRASVETMEAAVTEVDQGAEYAKKAGAALDDIRGSVLEVVRVVNDIVGAIQEQSTASQIIAQRVESVAQATEENDAAAQNMATSAQGLDSLAGSLSATIARFKI